MTDWKTRFCLAAQQAGLAPRVDRFFFLRHGQTNHNRDRVVQGWLDTPLNGTGEEQARQSARALAGMPVTGMVCSSLQRARRTAELVGEHTGYALAGMDDRLWERNHGTYEGGVAPDDNVWVLEDRGAESYETFSRRTAAGLNDALQEGVPLIVAHGGTRRVLFYALGLDLPDHALGNAVPLEFSRTGGVWKVRVMFIPEVSAAGAEM